MKISSIKDSIKYLNKFTLIITYGDEYYYREQLKSKVIFNNPKHIVQSLDSSEFDIDNLRFKDLFGEKRIFIIKNANKIDSFKPLLEIESEDIVILDDDKINVAKINTLKEKALIFESKKPSSWEEEKQIVGKIQAFFKNKNYEIDESAVKYLYDNIGYNLYKLSNELQKLILYKENPGKITIADINSVGIANNNLNSFNIINFIVDGQKKEALSMLNKVFKKQNNQAILLISSWYSHFEKLLYLKTTDKKISDVSEFMGLHTYIIETKLKPQLKKFSASKLLKILKSIADIELKIKQSSIDIKFYLEEFILDF